VVASVHHPRRQLELHKSSIHDSNVVDAEIARESGRERRADNVR
jgi:hypothetical protein